MRLGISISKLLPIIAKAGTRGRQEPFGSGCMQKLIIIHRGVRGLIRGGGSNGSGYGHASELKSKEKLHENQEA